jgi:hypothetical protein
MTLTIEVAPEVESRLQEKAARLGVPVERYAAGVLRRDVESNDDPRAPVIASRLAALGKLRELAAGTRAGWPPLSDSAISRENIYAGRGE